VSSGLTEFDKTPLVVSLDRATQHNLYAVEADVLEVLWLDMAHSPSNQTTLPASSTRSEAQQGSVLELRWVFPVPAALVTRADRPEIWLGRGEGCHVELRGRRHPGTTPSWCEWAHSGCCAIGKAGTAFSSTATA